MLAVRSDGSFSGEGPRSRRHRRTAAMRLIVQPYDEDDDDYYFFPFPSNGALVEWNWQGKTEELGEKPIPVSLCPPQIPYGLTRDRTRACAVGGRRLTAWAMARPKATVGVMICWNGYLCIGWDVSVLSGTSLCWAGRLYCVERIRLYGMCVGCNVFLDLCSFSGTTVSDLFLLCPPWRVSKYAQLHTCIWMAYIYKYHTMSGGRIPVEARFSALVQTGAGVHPASYTMVPALFFFGGGGRG
jgi:hypothetical protein